MSRTVAIKTLGVSKRFSRLLPIIAAILASGLDTPRNWVEVRSPNFTVLTDATEKQGRHIAAQFERMRSILQGAYPQFERDGDSAVVILAIKDKKTFRALEPNTYLSKASLTLHGLYLGVSDKNYILMRLDAEGGNPYPIVYHEYTHLMLNGLASPLPLWLNEGLAEFYAPTEIYDREVVFGRIIQLHLQLLRQENLLPLPTLFTIDDKSPYYSEKKKGSIFYAESWALVHYLKQEDYAERTSELQQYINLVSEKMDPVTAGIRVFGDLKELQKRLAAYIEQPSSNHFTTTLVNAIDDSDFDTISITPAQAQGIEADFLVNSGRLEEAQLLVNDLLRRDPGDSFAQESKALLELAKEQQAETELRSAVESNPQSAAAYDQLAVFLWKRGRKLEEANQLESKAVYLDPTKLDYQINRANILLGMGQMQTGLEVLKKASVLAGTADEVARINFLMHDAETYISAQERPPDRPRTESTMSASDKGERATNSVHQLSPAGSHRFIFGVLTGVNCDTPNLDLTVISESKAVSLHSENYYRIKFTALFSLTGDLDPCKDLENRRAKVEYVEPVDGSQVPDLIAVELHK